MKNLALLLTFIVFCMMMELAYGQNEVTISVTGDYHYIDLTQTGSADHSADINLTGESIGLEITQSGNMPQNFSLTNNCVNPAGCGVIIIQQGF